MGNIAYRAFLVAVTLWSLLLVATVDLYQGRLTVAPEFVAFLFAVCLVPFAVLGLWYERTWGLVISIGAALLAVLSAMSEGVVEALSLASMHFVLLLVVLTRLICCMEMARQIGALEDKCPPYDSE